MAGRSGRARGMSLPEAATQASRRELLFMPPKATLCETSRVWFNRHAPRQSNEFGGKRSVDWYASLSRSSGIIRRTKSSNASFLPSARLFLQKGGNGPRTGGQHSYRARETKPFPKSFFFVASTETSALLEKRNHLIREGLKTLGINIHKQVEAVGGTLVDPLLHEVDDLLRCADEPIMSAAASGDNLTNGDGSVLQQTVSRCPVSG